MLLGRLRVRQKLALLVLPLLVLVVIGAVPLVTTRLDAVTKSTRTAAAIDRAVRIGELVQELQQERLASLGFLSAGTGRDRVVVRSARVLDLAEQLLADFAANGRDDKLATVLQGVGRRSDLGGLRIQILRGDATGIGAYTGFTAAIQGLIDVLDLNQDADLSTPTGRQELALDAIIRHDEATSAAGTALFVEPGRQLTPRVLALVSGALAIEDREERVFKPLADPAAFELYEQVEEGQSGQQVAAYLEKLTSTPSAAQGVQVDSALLPKVEAVTALSRLVETRIAASAVGGAADSAARDRWLAGLGVALALIVLLGAAVLSVLISRSIARPLRRLTASADEVADAARDELVRVADTEDAQAAAPRLRPVKVGTSDELGELAKAFNRVQEVAAQLVERQVVGRRNVATMFGNVGRRTQNLVGRQLAMIDSLERNEQDPALLDRLYRLDHVSTRLRRNANSLVVLSGAAEPELVSEPLSVADAVRSALGEIEGFQRVRLTDVEPALLTPQVAPDVILLLAELLENGTSFSPPHTEVEVGATRVGGGDVLVRIVDHGLGMTPEQLDAENARLVERERLDLAPTDVLGLFVVGRLARRHGIQVTLRPTTGTGVTADVLIPAACVVAGSVPLAGPTDVPDRAGAERLPVSAGALAGPGGGAAPARGWWEPAVADEPVAAAPASSAAPPAAPAGPDERAVRTDAPAPPRPAGEVGPGGIVRRVRGAQLPDTGGPAPVAGPPPAAAEPPAPVGSTDPAESTGSPAAPEAAGSPGPTGSPDEARRAIEDFEEGVRRALQESAAARAESDESPRRNGHVRLSGTPLPGPVPRPPLPPSGPPAGPADPTRALLEDFEDGVRRALARIDAVTPSGPAGGDGSSAQGTFFQRHPSRPVPAAGANGAAPSPPAGDAAAPRSGGRDTSAAGATAGPAAGDPGPPSDIAPAGAAGATGSPTTAGPVAAAASDSEAAAEGPTASAEGSGARTGDAGQAGTTADAAPAEPAAGAAGSAPDAAPTGDAGRPSGTAAGVGGPGAGGAEAAGERRAGDVPAPRTAAEDGTHPLLRRVRGAQMPDGARGARPAHQADPPEPSADAAAREAEAARALVEEFEAGVQRALGTGDRGPGARDEEGAG